MTLIFSRSTKNLAVIGVVCDRCSAKINDEIKLGEVLHIRLTAGVGSEWGDRNTVELELCDGCAHELLSPYARVAPSAEMLTGKFGVGLGVHHRLAHEDQHFVAGDLSDGEPVLPSWGTRNILMWMRYMLMKYFIPVTLVLRAVGRQLARSSATYEYEERKLRARYLHAVKDLSES